MKTIAYRDIAGGTLHAYSDDRQPNQKRLDRITSALKELRHTGCIVVYLINGNKQRKLFRKLY